MSTFNFDVSPKEQDGLDGVMKVNEFILHLLMLRMSEKKMTRTKLAKKLGLDKSTVSRMLRGNQNLTSRTIGEICGALDFDFELTGVDLLAASTNVENKQDPATNQPFYNQAETVRKNSSNSFSSNLSVTVG